MFFFNGLAGNRYILALSVDKQDLIKAYSLVKHGAKCQQLRLLSFSCMQPCGK